MLDAVGGHVAKRIQNRHVGALTRPVDCAELLRVRGACVRDWRAAKGNG